MTRFSSRAGALAIGALAFAAAATLPLGATTTPADVAAQPVANAANITVDPALYRQVYYRPLTGVQPRRPRHRRHRRAVEPAPLLHGRRRRRRMEVDRRAAHAGSRSPTARFGVGTIGAIDVALSDPNVIYVGTGSADPRGNVTNGDGVYKSTDAGKTWTHVGLREGRSHRPHPHPSAESRTSRSSPRSATSSGPTRSAASIARRTAARPGSRC